LEFSTLIYDLRHAGTQKKFFLTFLGYKTTYFMEKSSEPKKYKNSFLNWIEYRLPIISYIEKEY